MAVTVTPSASSDTYLGDSPDVNRLLDNVQATVPAVGLAVVKMEAWNAIETFYRDSTTRREMLYWTMPPGTIEVDFDPFDEDWQVCWVLHWDGLERGRIIPPGRLRDLQFPQSQLARNGRALVALKPAGFVANTGGVAWSQWFNIILSGTLARLFMQPAKPYSSPQLAQFHGRTFRSGIASARAIAQAEWTDGGGRWRFPLFAPGRAKN